MNQQGTFGNNYMKNLKLFTAIAMAMAFLMNLPFAIAKTAGDGKPQDKSTPGKWEAMFNKADTNHSGGLSRAELKKTDKDRFTLIKENFKAMDTNKDGEVTIAERDAFINKTRNVK